MKNQKQICASKLELKKIPAIQMKWEINCASIKIQPIIFLVARSLIVNLVGVYLINCLTVLSFL